MSENKQHPYAEILRAIADGEEIQFKFPVQTDTWENQDNEITLDEISRVRYGVDCYRRKPKTIRIGEFDVPDPLRVAPAKNTDYWFASLWSDSGVCESYWSGDDKDYRSLERGIIHLTKEAAELHAKALISLTTQK